MPTSSIPADPDLHPVAGVHLDPRGDRRGERAHPVGVRACAGRGRPAPRPAPGPTRRSRRLADARPLASACSRTARGSNTTLRSRPEGLRLVHRGVGGVDGVAHREAAPGTPQGCPRWRSAGRRPHRDVGDARSRSATSQAPLLPVPGRSTTNSSPPISRRQVARCSPASIVWATARRHASPPSRPCAAFTSLNASRSRISTAKGPGAGGVEGVDALLQHLLGWQPGQGASVVAGSCAPGSRGPRSGVRAFDSASVAMFAISRATERSSSENRRGPPKLQNSAPSSAGAPPGERRPLEPHPHDRAAAAARAGGRQPRPR